MVNTETRIDAPAVVTAGRSLAIALAEYRAKPTSPERLWNFQEAHWNLNRFAMGLPKSDVIISTVPYTEDQMREFMGFGRLRRKVNPDFALFLPEVASTPEGLKFFGKVYPELTSSSFQEGTPVENKDREGNIISLHGWMRTESGIDAPYTSTNEDQAREIVRKNGRQGQTLNVYVEAGQQSKLLIGQHLDEVHTWVRIMSSRVDGRVVDAYWDAGGGCHVLWLLRPGYIGGDLGVRSAGV